jgi:hypothetical protein
MMGAGRDTARDGRQRAKGDRVRSGRQRRRILRRSLSLAVVMLAGTAALAACGGSPKPKAAAAENCGSSKSAANVPILVEVDKGHLACSVALSVEKSYAAAIVAGKVPGNGGGAPYTVNGWTCQGLPTPKVLKTGDTSTCTKAGAEIVAVLKTST